MSYFTYKNETLFCEEVDVSLIAKKYSTPCYIYSQGALHHNLQLYLEAINERCRIHYAVKANSNLAILQFFANKNIGFDIVSVGELERVLVAGGDPKKIIFSGVGKRADEIIRAMHAGIGCFDVESMDELERIHHLAQQENIIVNIALRINPNIDAGTHPYISTGLYENKFGIFLSDVLPICEKMTNMPYIKCIGLACHIGSQLNQLEPFLMAIDSLLELSEVLLKRGIPLQHLNIGGGLGVSYQGELIPSITDYISAIMGKCKNTLLDIIIEPGRSLVANAGILLTQIEYLKHTPHKNFAIVDAAMNDLIRPALYEAWHDIRPVNLSAVSSAMLYDVVGPVCETADFIGKNRELSIAAGDLLAIFTAGAYGFCMSSNYNSRPRAAEILVDGNTIHLVRARETITELWHLEHLI